MEEEFIKPVFATNNITHLLVQINTPHRPASQLVFYWKGMETQRWRDTEVKLYAMGMRWGLSVSLFPSSTPLLVTNRHHLLCRDWVPDHTRKWIGAEPSCKLFAIGEYLKRDNLQLHGTCQGTGWAPEVQLHLQWAIPNNGLNHLWVKVIAPLECVLNIQVMLLPREIQSYTTKCAQV